MVPHRVPPTALDRQRRSTKRHCCGARALRAEKEILLTGIAAVADAAQQRAGFHGVTNTSGDTSALQLPEQHLDRTAAMQYVVVLKVSSQQRGR